MSKVKNHEIRPNILSTDFSQVSCCCSLQVTLGVSLYHMHFYNVYVYNGNVHFTLKYK